MTDARVMALAKIPSSARTSHRTQSMVAEASW